MCLQTPADATPPHPSLESHPTPHRPSGAHAPTQPSALLAPFRGHLDRSHVVAARPPQGGLYESRSMPRVKAWPRDCRPRPARPHVMHPAQRADLWTSSGLPEPVPAHVEESTEGTTSTEGAGGRRRTDGEPRMQGPVYGVSKWKTASRVRREGGKEGSQRKI